MRERRMYEKKKIDHWFIRSVVQSVLVLSLGLCLLTGRAVAQQPPANDEVAEARATSAPTSTTATALVPAAPAPVQEPVALGGYTLKNTIEVGYRWRDYDGNEDVYRSHVNLGNGVRLLHSSFELRAPESSGRLFDLLSVNLDNWGGDPYNTTHVRLKKNLWYDFEYRYQKIDYYNFIPEFANPLFNPNLGAREATDALLGQHSFDMTRRMSNAQLRLFPDAERFQAHIAYGRNSAYGPAFRTVNLGGDEFLISRMVRNTVNDYRFGFDVRFWKLGISFEQGFREFRDDEGDILPGGFSLGNSPEEIFGFYQASLTNFNRSYFARGFIPTTRVAVTSHHIPRVVFNARLYYSDAEFDQDFSRALTGTVLPREAPFIVGSQFSVSHGEPSKPYTVADGTVRVNVTRRFALMNTFRGAHFVIDGGRVLNDQFIDFDFPEDPPYERQETSYRYTFLNSFMNQFEGDYAITNNLIVRAGYRYNRRRATLRQRNIVVDSFAPDFPITTMRERESTQKANTGFVGGSYRLRRFIRVAADYERGEYLTEFLDVDTRDFQRGRLRLQFNPADQWRFTVFGSVFDQTRPNRSLAIPSRTLENQNRSRSGGFSVSWFPTERVALDLDYTRGHIIAYIHTFIVPSGASRPVIVYKEDSNVAHAGVDLRPFKEIRLGFGYRLVNSNGSYPISFHRPYGYLSIPFHRVVSLNLNYQHYGYNEHLRSVQDYRANLLTTSLKFSF